MKNVFVIGVGLIGGSFALDIKSVYPDTIIYGIDVNKSHLEEALDLGVIEEVEEVFKNVTSSIENKASFRAIGVNEIKQFIDNKTPIYDLGHDQRGSKLTSKTVLDIIEDKELPIYLQNNKEKLSEWFI
mgnify:CR=1 FL=1